MRARFVVSQIVDEEEEQVQWARKIVINQWTVVTSGNYSSLIGFNCVNCGRDLISEETVIN